MHDILQSMMFIHIPKNGGTTMEAVLKNQQTIISRPHAAIPRNFLSPHSGWVSPWHMPPDMYEEIMKQRYNSKGFEKRFCIVRNPIDRYISDMHWSNWAFRTPFAKLAEMYAQNWAAVRWTEEAVHRMPQHMFVFSRSGHVQCDCIIAIERLKNITSVKKNTHNIAHSPFELPEGFFALYSADHMIWSAALKNHSLCHQEKSMAIW